jgi:hypothetical protein
MDELDEEHLTQAWLAVNDEPLAGETGEYYYRPELRPPNPKTLDVQAQDKLPVQRQGLLGHCFAAKGVSPPAVRRSAPF